MRLSFFIFFLFLSFISLSQEVKNCFFEWTTQNNKPVLNLSDSHIFNFDYVFDDELSDVSLIMSNATYIDCDSVEIQFLQNLDVKVLPELNYVHGIERKKSKIKGSIFPFILNDSTYQKLVYCNLEIDTKTYYKPKSSSLSSENSVLSSGNWYKIAVTESGIHKLSYQNLSDIGLNISAINPKNIRLYGRPGGMLPTENSEPRIDDLEELTIKVVGESDGAFNTSDYVLFYGQSPHSWDLNSDHFQRNTHLFEDKTYYFITTDLGQGKRIMENGFNENADTIISSFNDFQHHENNDVNFIKSGREWYGDVFDIINQRSYNFNFPNRIGEASLKIVVAARANSPYNSNFTFNTSGNTESLSIAGVNGSYNYANTATYQKDVSPMTDNINVVLNFESSSSTAKGWLDYILINAERELKMAGSQMQFRSLSSVKPNSISQFVLTNANPSIIVWDVTDPLSPQKVKYELSSNQLSFTAPTQELKEFIAFSNTFKSVELLGKIQNQNLHSFENLDYVIVSHPNFITEANRLADFHSQNNLSVQVVTPQQIYNEFSAGSQDVSAIRDFAKMLYESTHPLKYMLLFGDASYDPKNRLLENSNYIVSYQSTNSTNSLYSFVSDDYFALLDEGESISNNNTSFPFLDIGVGRFPVQTVSEARTVVDKVLNYNAIDALGDWRLRMCFVGDDNDEVETVHSAQAEQLADYISSANPEMNVDKIYLDSYSQETSTGGQRCPQVNDAISNAVNKGMFLVNYTGHGGELGWAHERILEIDDIYSWSNKYKMPLFMTATCEFGRYDDPDRVSAAEHVFLKDEGGAIALLTTSRVVFTNGNLDLNTSFLENLFPMSTDSINPTLGDVLMRTKNNVNNIDNLNHRNFTLLGDPALTLAYPKFEVVLTQVQDSAKALGKLTISGEIHLNGVKSEDFNGFVYPTVFDKRDEFQTLGQDESPVLIFDLQKSILFNGKSSIQNGSFSFSFIVPKDISYDFGKGKISLYAVGSSDGVSYVDALGFTDNFIIGGTAENYEDDFIGPSIRLFMNDTNFILGGITNPNPDLLALLQDDNGINTVGNGIGHDMLAILNENSANPIVLNDFFEYDADSYQKGKISYPFTNLDEGKHTLTVKVWDVHNNSSERSTSFRVIKSTSLSIENLINYPNPVDDFTSFYFEHNQSGSELDILLNITDVNGRVVKTITDKLKPDGFRYGPLHWNGQSSQNTKLKSGLYIYTLTAKATDGEIVSKSGRLILID
ncbi:MAG: type IX secretion system sortase PorU [Flavobacteriales bacterium]